jgi:hypothetical protein
VTHFHVMDQCEWVLPKEGELDAFLDGRLSPGVYELTHTNGCVVRLKLSASN